jgi:hypothetical protein
MKITDAHFDRFLEDGFIILPGYYEEARRRPLAEAQRRVLKTWDQVKDDPPADRAMYAPWPTPEKTLNLAIAQDEEVHAFARRYLKTDHIHYRAGLMIARYPGFKGDHGVPHIDNGNNSLLPKAESPELREFGQLTFWFHLEEVGEDQAPLQLIPNRYGKDMSKAVKLVCPPGTLCIFTTYNWHSAGDYTRADGQRFTWGIGFGRADHYWEGFRHYTDMGQNPHFRAMVGELTARQRELFRFPPAGHRYYTKQTLAALEEQYPGWNARGEYRPADA